MSLVEIDLLGSNGDVIELRETTGTYQLPAGLTGTGMLQRDVELIEGPGISWVRSVRSKPREINLPILLLTSSRTGQQAAQRRLARALQWSDTTPPQLRWASETTERYLLDVTYQGGSETTWGSRTGTPKYTRWLLSLLAPDGYWRAENPVNLPVLTTEVGDPLLPNLANLNVSPASLSGLVDLTNPGEVDAPPIWQLHGPWTALTLALAGDELSFDAVDSSTLLTVDCMEATVIDASGVNRYDLLGAAPRFFLIPDGSSQLEITATGTDTSTVITGHFYPRFETVF